MTVAIIRTDAAGPAARLHGRMPVVLADPDTMRAWLSTELQIDDVLELLAPVVGDRITVLAVSGLVKSLVLTRIFVVLSGSSIRMGKSSPRPTRRRPRIRVQFTDLPRYR